MSGATDAPFRRQAVKFGAAAVVSEMVAGESLAQARPDVVRRTCRHEGDAPWIVQLAARRPGDVRKGAELLAEAGVDVIDINMGCPSKQVTGGQSGSALMREPELAARIIDGALEGAGSVPVTLKMRLGWDHDSLNAPQLAKTAETAGVQMITVHGRTRCMFYEGTADWDAISETVGAVSVPVIANGDIIDTDTAKRALQASGAHGVMVGRAAVGRPWIVGQIDRELRDAPIEVPDLSTRCESLCEQVEDSVSLYGVKVGVRTVRKHISAAIDDAPLSLSSTARRELRARLCRIDAPDSLVRALRAVFENQDERIAA